MPVDTEAFFRLCQQLRQLGAVKVEGHGFSATFMPQQQATPKPFAPPKPTREPPLDDAAAREMLRQRELGHV